MNIVKNRVVASCFIILYAFVFLVPNFDTLDTNNVHWLYISCINILCPVYFFIFRKSFSFTFDNKVTKLYFIVFTGFFLLSLLSSLWAINASETIVYTIKVLTTLIAALNLYFLTKNEPIEIFNSVSKVILLLLFCECIYVISHFTQNAHIGRSIMLLQKLITEHYQNYSNVNILSAALTLKIPFVFYCLLNFSKLWKWLAVFTISATMSATLLIGARTGSYSFFILLLLFSSYVFYHKFYKNEIYIYIPMLGILIISFFFTLNLNRIDGGRTNSLQQMYSPVKRVRGVTKKFDNIHKNTTSKLDLKAFTSSSGRDVIWNHAYQVFLKKPMLGWGVGNWKLTPHETLKLKLKTNIYLNTQRVHNDYLQVLAELGIVGFILFIANVLIIPFVILIRSLKQKHYNNTKKRNILFVLGMLLLYFQIDMFINFPIYWASIIIFLFIGIVFILNFYSERTKESQLKRTSNDFFFLVVILLLSVFTTYKNYKRVISSIYERDIYSEISNKTYEQWADLKSSYEDIMRKLENVDQDLDDVGCPLEGLKAIYAISEKKYTQAKKHLRKSIKQAPNNHVAKSVLARVYLDIEKNRDSAYLLANEVFSKIPTDLTTYIYLRKIYKENRDTINLLKLINKRLLYVSDDVIAWKNKAFYNYHKFNKDTIFFSKILDSAILVTPKKSKELIKYKTIFLKTLSAKRKNNNI